ncbi:MAG: hypothetical protein ACI9Y1_001805 [Lentisphaeria bacterium]|jgi:hypothetical protein
MNKATFALLSVLAVDGAIAAEAGASNPQSSGPAAANATVAIAETGTNTGWVQLPLNIYASKRATKAFELSTERLSANLNQKFEQKLAEQLDQLLAK